MSAAVALLAILVTALVVAVIVAVPLGVAIRFVVAEAGKSREVAQARAVAQQTYITELQNRLFAHSWTDFAQLQNDVDSHTGQTARVLNSFGEDRSEESYGESPDDLLNHALASLGSDLEGEGFADTGPTVG